MKNILSSPMPPRVASLRRDDRGYPIPYPVLYDAQGKPDFRVVDPDKWMRAIKCRLCGVCGDPLGAHLAFVGGPGSMESRYFTDLPMHRDCAIYALQTCPFLAAPRFQYSRSISPELRVNESVSTKRPETFGLGIARSFELAQAPGGDVVLRAGVFESIAWWRHGVATPSVISTEVPCQSE